MKKLILTLTRPLRKKMLMRWFFRRFKGEKSSFYKSDLTDPLRFLIRIFWKILILALPNLRLLKNFDLTKKCGKMVMNTVSQFSAQRALEGVNRSGAWWFKSFFHFFVNLHSQVNFPVATIPFTLYSSWPCAEHFL